MRSVPARFFREGHRNAGPMRCLETPGDQQVLRFDELHMRCAGGHCPSYRFFSAQKRGRDLFKEVVNARRADHALPITQRRDRRKLNPADVAVGRVIHNHFDSGAEFKGLAKQRRTVFFAQAGGKRRSVELSKN